MLGLSHSCHGHIIRVMLSAQLRYRCSIRTVLLAMFLKKSIFKRARGFLIRPWLWCLEQE